VTYSIPAQYLGNFFRSPDDPLAPQQLTESFLLSVLSPLHVCLNSFPVTPAAVREQLHIVILERYRRLTKDVLDTFSVSNDALRQRSEQSVLPAGEQVFTVGSECFAQNRNRDVGFRWRLFFFG